MNPALPIAHKAPSGFILLELVIAITIFSIAVLGLTNALSTAVGAVAEVQREQLIQEAARSYIEELRLRPLADMNTTYADPILGISLVSEVRPLDLTSDRGRTYPGLHELRVQIQLERSGQPFTETVSVYVYRP